MDASAFFTCLGELHDLSEKFCALCKESQLSWVCLTFLCKLCMYPCFWERRYWCPVDVVVVVAVAAAGVYPPPAMPTGEGGEEETWLPRKSCKFLETGALNRHPVPFSACPIDHTPQPPSPQQCTSQGQHFQSRFDQQTERRHSDVADLKIKRQTIGLIFPPSLPPSLSLQRWRKKLKFMMHQAVQGFL